MLLFESYIKTDKLNSINSVIKYSNLLNIDPNWLMAVIYKETAGTFDPSIVNQINHTATGLIQFMPDTAIYLGTTVNKLRLMSFPDQMYYVYKYFIPYKSKIKSYSDLYLCTFFPAALNYSNNPNYIFHTSNLPADTIAKFNPVIDLNHDLQITMQEFINYTLNGFSSNTQSVLKKKMN